MSLASKILSDGNYDFSAGMDSYTSPIAIDKNGYVCSINMRLVSGKTGIRTRQGFREVVLNFSDKKTELLYRNSTITGTGYFLNLGAIVIIAACNGHILRFEEKSRNEFKVYDTGFKVFKGRTYFSSAPNGLIVNDGISKAIYFYGGSIRIANRSEMASGLGGVYVQNRFFCISEDSKNIMVSSFNDPLSLEESRLANFSGYYTPDGTDFIAVGEQKHLAKDSQGGSLVISSSKNIFSVDVRGKMSSWGASEIGKISGDIYDVSAVSQNSFLSVNGNVYFRSRHLGLASLQYMQQMFVNSDSMAPQSYSGSLFFDNDEISLLGDAISVRCNNSIYTTVSPERKNGGVIWNGIMTCKPEQRGTLRYDSVYTGVRPWAICQPDTKHGEELMYIHSCDHDDVNRMYILDDTIDYDISLKNGKKEIESKLLTRLFAFDNGFLIKKPESQYYSISEFKRDVSVVIKTRPRDSGGFCKIFSRTHKNSSCTIEGGIFVNKNATEGARDLNPFTDNQSSIFAFKQDLIEITGACSLNTILRQCIANIPDKTVKTEEQQRNVETYEPERLFSYKIAE